MELQRVVEDESVQEGAFGKLAAGDLRGPSGQAGQAFEIAWERLRAAVAKSLACLHVSPEYRKDCGQNAFLRIWANRESYRGSTRGELIAWIHRITEREFLQILRREGRAPDAVTDLMGEREDDSAPSERLLEWAVQLNDDPTAEQVENSDTMRALDQCIQTLSAKVRTVLEHLYLPPQLTERDAAKALGISKAYVHSLKEQAMAELRRCLQRKGVT